MDLYLHCVNADLKKNRLFSESIHQVTFRIDLKIDLFRKESPSLVHGHDLTASKLTATAGSDVVQSGRPIFDDFFQHLWPSIGNNTANVVFQRVKRLWLIRIDQ
ncbi:hypothetical protein TNCV_4854251 [Trichonephila clavipes]|nr:hypothetical protein TNCV_4854251 [Trichonephila clavipes]